MAKPNTLIRTERLHALIERLKGINEMADEAVTRQSRKPCLMLVA
ncbi:hypothetical protein [Mesorhizobium sp. ES1-3]|nr:hypothetical protein [Mesorhizobium sp. ES1-3]